MDENSRIIPRTRPRPYDLRRKVLLKNFLREQMTYIPSLREMSDAVPVEDNESSLVKNQPSSIGNEENIETNANLQDKVLSSKPAVEPVPSSSSTNDLENHTGASTNQTSVIDDTPEEETVSQPKFSRFANMVKRRMARRKAKKKGISKAKHEVKAIKSPKRSVLKISKKTSLSHDDSSSERSRSFFSRFKSRRNKKRDNSEQSNPLGMNRTITFSVARRTTTISQSVQTDLSWAQEDYKSMQQSNRCLQEENRLLSESLSFMMSDVDLSPRKKFRPDSYNSGDITLGLYSNPPKRNHFEAKTSHKSDHHQNHNSKVLRSKSMQERPERRNLPRFCHRTRSMNQGPSNTPSHNEFYTGRSKPISPVSNYDFRANRTQNLPRSSFSSPKGSSPNRQKPTRNSSNFSPPPYGANRLPVLNSLPINSSGRTILRRSSMPERRSYEPTRPILRPRSNSIRDYNRRSYTPERLPLEPVRPMRPCRRYSNVSDYSRPVPFRDLPSEAFY